LVGVFAFARQRIRPELAKIYIQHVHPVEVWAGCGRQHHRGFPAHGQGQPLPRTLPPGIGLRDKLEPDHVSYSYPNAEGAGLPDITLDIRRGERIGIVGSTSAGKTTLANIVLGLLTPQDGGMRVDDTPITADALRARQQSVSNVPQGIFLAVSTIIENTTFGVRRSEIDTERATRCGNMTQRHDFITTKLAAGYDTTVEERSVRRSGGQRQRVGIARATTTPT
jgi:ABC-type bacteriocin/lantibiotic exporter with double-glycine peptidase domain